MTAGPGGSATGAFAAASAGGSSVGLAPNAPGRLGDAVPADALLGYLGALLRWRQDRRAELDRLDQTSLRSGQPDSFSGDLVLAMSLWQSTSDRVDAIETAWDSGRADRTAREKISQLVWGRLDSGLGTGFAISFVEACRLSDAIVAQLRTRLALDPATGDTAARLTAVRAQLERCRELADPVTLTKLARLRGRLDDLAEQVGRGADVTGPVRVLENEAAVIERDLIVAAGRRTNAVRDRERAAELVASLQAREAPLRELAARCRDRIADPPRLGIPDVTALGPVPTDVTALTDYLHRLERVSEAMTMAERSYAAPLAERDDLRGLLDGYRAMAQVRQKPEPALEEAYQRARTALWTAPCNLSVARGLVAVYQAMVHGGGART
jgi:hypothetical protein